MNSISCVLKGGLGNMMFQISATYALAYRNNSQCHFDFIKHLHLPRTHKPATAYVPNIFKHINNQPITQPVSYQYDDLIYKEIPYNPDIVIDGYFQSEKYFVDYREQLLTMFEMSNSEREYILNKYGALNQSISLHVRRGDYAKWQNIHCFCTLDYYKNAIKNFPNKRIVVISDDINWCKLTFNFDNMVFIDGEQDYIDLYIMSLCEHNIIANSSFSWWGAWLNQNTQKKVIAPKRWFCNSPIETFKDIFCDDWILL